MNIHKNEKLLEAFDKYVRLQNDLLPDEEALSTITFSEEFRERMHRLLSRQKWGFYVLFGTAGRRIASFVVAALVAATVTTISVEALREPVARFFAEVYEKFTQVFFVDETPDSPEVEMEKRVPTYIPEGYVLKRETDLHTTLRVVYINDSDMEIRYAQCWKKRGELRVDTEDIQSSVVLIRDNQGITYTNKDITTISFSDEKYTYTLSGPLSVEKLIEMAKSIEKM